MKILINYLLSKYIENKSASTVTEYALIAAVISVSIFIIVFVMGDNILTLFQSSDDALATAAAAN